MSGLKTFSSKLPDAPADVDGHVVAHHLRAQHRHRLGLRGVHLARHDGAARLVLRDRELADAASAGPEASQRTSLAILMSAAASVLSAPCACTSASLAASASNLLGAVTNGEPRQLRRSRCATRSAYPGAR